MVQRQKLEAILDPDKNSLTLVRLVAALMVIVSHASEIVLGRGALQPLEPSTPFNLGQHAVHAFFIISGLTLAQALAKNENLKRFLVARVLRIFPALLAYGLIASFALGPALTSQSLSDYYSTSSTYLYPLRVLIAFAHAPPPPGLFETVPVANTLNEPLWTIRYELAAYVGLALLALVGAFPSKSGVAAVSLVVTVSYAAVSAMPELNHSLPGVESLARFGFCFMIGVSAYTLRKHVVLSFAALLAFIPILWLLSSTVLANVAFVIFTAYAVFVFGAIRFGALSRWTKANDISYGTYIYGWPIQQTLMVVFPSMTVMANMLAALILAPLAGYSSWALVERRALELKVRLRDPEHHDVRRSRP